MFQDLIQKVLDNGQIYQEHLKNTKKYLDMMLNMPEIPSGKFIRSIIFYMFADPNITEKHFKTTAIIELIHTASIIHDDVVDNNSNRRGVGSLLKLYGSKLSVLKGDFLLISAFKNFMQIYEGDSFAVKYFLRESYSTAYGAIREQILNKSTNPTVSEYLRVTSLKTAPLFKLSALLGAHISRKTFKQCREAAIYALLFGIIFQIQNDLDSYKSNSFQDSEDYMQKHITLPIIIMNENKLLDINDFRNRSNQEDYALIKQFIISEEFKSVLKNLKDPLMQILHIWVDPVKTLYTPRFI